MKKYTIEELTKLASESISQPDMMFKMNLVPRGRNYSLFRKNLIDLGINTDHWRGRPVIKPPKVHTKDSVINELLVPNKIVSSCKLKEYLFRFKILEQICSVCAQGPIWNTKQLTLQLDHINGNFKDNRLENLRILCPNCHTQTITYCRKKSK